MEGGGFCDAKVEAKIMSPQLGLLQLNVLARKKSSKCKLICNIIEPIKPRKMIVTIDKMRLFHNEYIHIIHITKFKKISEF